VTTLIVTGENDEPAEIEELAAWLASLNRHVPLHLSRYFPRYHMTAPPTPAGTLRRCAEAARKHLDYVYVGNISAEELQDGT
jgi:pyruvate formate lyase activating enzyme